MYKRIPVSYFNSSTDIFFAVLDFMKDCGMTVISTNAKHLQRNMSGSVLAYVLYDSYYEHYIYLMLNYSFTEGQSVQNRADAISLYVADGYNSSKDILEQEGIAKTIFEYNDNLLSVVHGAALTINYDEFSHSCEEPENINDLTCIYNNKSIIFVVSNNNTYKHMYGGKHSSLLFYGCNTNYHLNNYQKRNVLCFSLPYYSKTGYIQEAETPDVFRIDIIGNYQVYGLFYAEPEASYTIFNNNWFSYDGATVALSPPLLAPSDLKSSFEKTDSYGSYRLVDYADISSNNSTKGVTRLGNNMNFSSYLIPIIFYGQREPRVLGNYSPILETKLVNLVDTSFISNGKIFIDTGIEHDYHKYFVFEYGLSSLGSLSRIIYSGVAIEIEAKEKLLYSQSSDYLTINLEDSFRNFDRFEIVYEGNNEVEWTYDDLVAIFDTDGVFNLTKDENNKCMVYGLKNEDGESREYRFTCSESCKIISITGYRE